MPNLTTPNKRKKLVVRRAPHWQALSRGRGEPARGLGYVATKGGKPGIWQVRVRVGGEKTYNFKTLGSADDLSHVAADGLSVLNYQQAIQKAMKFDPWAGVADDYDDAEAPTEEGDAPSRYEPGTVGRVCEEYVGYYENHRRSADGVRFTLNAHVMPELGDIPLERLTVGRLRKWHEGLASKPAHVRTSKYGKKKRTRKATTDDEKRARRVTANNVLRVLKAALHRSWLHGNAGRVIGPWSGVSPFKNVERPRERYLDRDEAQRLVNACVPDFRQLVLAAIYTGARYAELTGLRVADVRVESSSVFIEAGKSGKSRHVFLNDEALSFFESASAGRAGDEPLFVRADGKSWQKNHQQKRMRAACEETKLKPPIVFHGLRHTYASLYLMAGGGLSDLAKQLGHSTTRMVEKHYGHFSDSWRADQATQFAPSLGVESGRVRRFKRASAEERAR